MEITEIWGLGSEWMKGQTVNGGMAGGWEERAKDPACLTDACLPHLLTVLRDSGGQIRRSRGKEAKTLRGRGRLGFWHAESTGHRVLC